MALVCEWCGWSFSNDSLVDCRNCYKPLNNPLVDLIECGLIEDFRRPETRQARRLEVRLNMKAKACVKSKIPWSAIVEDLQ